MKARRGEASEAIVTALLKQMAADDRPIIVGPWRRGAGGELLYWLPFLRWAVREFGLDRARIVAVSRGGAASWYQDLAGRYLDIYAVLSPPELEALDQGEKVTEDTDLGAPSAGDDTVLTRLGVSTDAHRLHPGLMHALFRPYQKGAAPFRLFSRSTVFTRMAPPDHPILAELPSEFIAVKFDSWRNPAGDSDLADFVERFTLDMAEAGPVVFIQSHLQRSAEQGFPAPRHPNVVSTASWSTPADSLAVQSAIFSRASHAFTAFGALSYLPLYYGVPVAAFYAEYSASLRHNAQAMFHMAEQLDAPLGVVPANFLSVVPRR